MRGDITKDFKQGIADADSSSYLITYLIHTGLSHCITLSSPDINARPLIYILAASSIDIHSHSTFRHQPTSLLLSLKPADLLRL
jgi:hypothetical protein